MLDLGAHGPSACRGKLEVVAGPAAGSEIVLDEALTIGRGEEGPGRLADDPELSRLHARIAATSDALLWIEDLGSTNGTFVNGTRIPAPTVLHAGDEVLVGTTTLRVAATAAPAPAQPPERVVRPALRVVEGWALGALIPLGEEPVVIGRTGVAARALGHDAGVADPHARLSPTTSGGIVVEDLGSDSGTLVAGRPIPAPTLLKPGDRFQVGSSVLEVVPAAGIATTAEAGTRSTATEGVRARPSDLFQLIGARAPVTPQQVVRVVCIALVLGFAGTIAVRELAIHVFDVSGDIASLRMVPWVLATVLPIIGNSIGFYKIFRRPDEQSVKRYLAPTFGVPILFVVVQMFRLEEHTFAIVTTTIIVTVLSLAICATLMLRLRAHVARAQVAAVTGVERRD